MTDNQSAAGAQGPALPEPTSDIGVLFVHGIGAQTRGQTLAEFGGPFFRWLEDRYRGLDLRWRSVIGARPSGDPDKAALEEWRTAIENWASDGFAEGERPAFQAPLAALPDREAIVGRAILADAVVSDPVDPAAPAHAKLRIKRQPVEGAPKEEEWLLAESWWAETFSAPGFADLARWGFRVIPWTVGSHFGAGVRRRWAHRPGKNDGLADRAARWLLWLASLLGSVLALIGGLLATPLLLAVLGVLLLVSLLPIPQVREMLLKVQLKVASTLGDSYMLVSRPVEAALIVAQVRRDMDWLASRCRVVVVCAHSQGAAVAHKALQQSVPPRLKLLFTFGSGLKKLEELRSLFAAGRSYLHSGILTLIAMTVFGLCATWFVLIFLTMEQAKTAITDLIEGSGLMLVYLLVSAVVLYAGLRDHIVGFDLPELERWIARLRSKVAWIDCFATSDPVSNGKVTEKPGAENWSLEVCNRSSSLADHTSYWANRDHFLTLLMAQVANPELRRQAGLTPASELETKEEHLQWLGKRRRWRVGIANAMFWIAVLAVMLAVVQQPEAWQNVLLYCRDQIYSLWRTMDGLEAALEAPSIVSWPALGYLALALIPYWIARQQWLSWNEKEMRLQVEGGGEANGVFVWTALCLQSVIAAGIVYGDMPPYWIFVSIFLVTIFGILLTEPRTPKGITEETRESRGGVRSGGEKAWDLVAKTGSASLMLFVMAIFFWSGVTWLAREYLNDTILGFRPGDISAVAFGVVVTLVVWIEWLAWTWYKGRNDVGAPNLDAKQRFVE